jgi:hypothetical protein
MLALKHGHIFTGYVLLLQEYMGQHFRTKMLQYLHSDS